MTLRIENEETCRLAGESARLTGAIAVASRERPGRCAKLPGPGPSAAAHGDMPYDERGLPK